MSGMFHTEESKSAIFWEDVKKKAPEKAGYVLVVCECGEVMPAFYTPCYRKIDVKNGEEQLYEFVPRFANISSLDQLKVEAWANLPHAPERSLGLEEWANNLPLPPERSLGRIKK